MSLVGNCCWKGDADPSVTVAVEQALPVGLQALYFHTCLMEGFL